MGAARAHLEGRTSIRLSQYLQLARIPGELIVRIGPRRVVVVRARLSPPARSSLGRCRAPRAQSSTMAPLLLGRVPFGHPSLRCSRQHACLRGLVMRPLRRVGHRPLSAGQFVWTPTSGGRCQCRRQASEGVPALAKSDGGGVPTVRVGGQASPCPRGRGGASGPPSRPMRDSERVVVLQAPSYVSVNRCPIVVPSSLRHPWLPLYLSSLPRARAASGTILTSPRSGRVASLSTLALRQALGRLGI